jgi:hypothetical protein
MWVIIESKPVIKENLFFHLQAVDKNHHLVILICLSAS